MKRFLPVCLSVLFGSMAGAQIRVQTNLGIDTLFHSMSLDEKIGQMVQVDLSLFTLPRSTPIKLDTNKLREAIVTYKVGSILDDGLNHAHGLNHAQ